VSSVYTWKFDFNFRLFIKFSFWAYDNILSCEVIWWQHFTIFGYARSKMTDAELRNMVSKTLTCRIDKRWLWIIFLALTWSLHVINIHDLFGGWDMICAAASEFSGRTVVKRWTSFLRDVSTILVNMIH
jgi:hypothetical protein